MSAEEAARWLGYSLSDLRAAEKLQHDPDPFPRQVCFLAQQAAEKALKAVLVLLQNDFPFTHDLDRLRDLLPDGWAVKSAYPDLAELTIWAVEARYPADLPEAAPVDAAKALQIARAVYHTIEQDILNRLPS
jgi:HEPN domain-containing protein